MGDRIPPPADSMEGAGHDTGEGTAFTVRAAEPSPIPVLIAAPHGGRAYPPAVVAAMREPARAMLRLEDRRVDELAEAVAAATGAALIVAHAPRAVLDLNRSLEDVDWDMIEPAAGARSPRRRAPSRRARSGLGLVPRRLPGLGEVWAGRLPQAELDARIAAIHAPYHARIEGELARLRRRWGAALLIDLHSMPPLAPRHGDATGAAAARFVVGDRFGASCDGSLVSACFAHFARCGHPAAHNRPYAGGYALERHSAPRRGLHALQIEVDRRCYLDAAMRELGAGFAKTAALLSGLVRQLAAETALLAGGGTWPMAAE